MKYNLLGNTGLLVSELCLGTMTFGGKGYWANIGSLGQEDAQTLVKGAIDGGINFFDTANVYSYGESEELFGKSVLQAGINRDEIVVATKLRGRMGEGVNNVGLSRFHIFQSVDASLRRLQMDHIDLLYVHGVDPLTPVEEVMRSLNDIVNTGKVRYVGVCNWPAWKVMQGIGIAKANGWHSFKALHYFYSLAGRDSEREVIPMALDQQLGFMPWSPLAGGFMSGKFNRHTEKAGNARRDNFDFPPIDKPKAYDIIDILQRIAEAKKTSVAQVALAWVRQQKVTTSTIIGAKNLKQLQDNIGSTQVDLNGEDMTLIHSISALHSEYPQWMVERQGADRKF